MRRKVRVTRTLLLRGICPLTMVMGVKFRKSLLDPKVDDAAGKERDQGSADKFWFMAPRRPGVVRAL